MGRLAIDFLLDWHVFDRESWEMKCLVELSWTDRIGVAREMRYFSGMSGGLTSASSEGDHGRAEVDVGTYLRPMLVD